MRDPALERDRSLFLAARGHAGDAARDGEREARTPGRHRPRRGSRQLDPSRAGARCSGLDRARVVAASGERGEEEGGHGDCPRPPIHLEGDWTAHGDGHASAGARPVCRRSVPPFSAVRTARPNVFDAGLRMEHTPQRCERRCSAWPPSRRPHSTSRLPADGCSVRWGRGRAGRSRACADRADGRLLSSLVWALIGLLTLFALLWVLFLAPTTGKFATSFGSAVHDPKDFLITVPERGHGRRALLRRRERLHAHLRADAGRQHGPRRVLPARRLHRARSSSGPRSARAAPSASRATRSTTLRVGLPAARGDGGHRRCSGCHAAVVPALEPGTGAAPGADHDRDLDHPRRPDARPFRRRRGGHRVAGDDRHVRQPPCRRDPVLGHPALHPRLRGRDRGPRCGSGSSGPAPGW